MSSPEDQEEEPADGPYKEMERHCVHFQEVNNANTFCIWYYHSISILWETYQSFDLTFMCALVFGFYLEFTFKLVLT